MCVCLGRVHVGRPLFASMLRHAKGSTGRDGHTGTTRADHSTETNNGHAHTRSHHTYIHISLPYSLVVVNDS